MSLTLCGLGLGHPDEIYYEEKITANRIHERGQYNYSSWKQNNVFSFLSPFIVFLSPFTVQEIGWKLAATIIDCNCIVQAVMSKEPRDVNNKLVDHKTVRSELTILAADAKKIRAGIVKSLQITATHDEKFPIDENVFSIRDGCLNLDELAAQMMEQAFSYKSWNKEVLLLLGHQDKTSSLSLLPRDIMNVILQKRREVAISDLKQKVKQFANQ